MQQARCLEKRRNPRSGKSKKEPSLNLDNEAAAFAQGFVKEHVTAFRELAK
jgi:hypothetical protein